MKFYIQKYILRMFNALNACKEIISVATEQLTNFSPKSHFELHFEDRLPEKIVVNDSDRYKKSDQVKFR